MAVRPAFLGHQYQHRHFWIEASRLFSARPVTRRVGIEARGIRSFDDVVTTYTEPMLDTQGEPTVEADHYQLKFHTRRVQRFRGADLIDPAFIDAERESLLEKAHAAVTRGEAVGRRLNLVTPWDVAEDDGLARVLDESSGMIDVEALFTGTRRSKVGAMREAWRARLGNPDDDVLAATVGHLRFWPNHRLPVMDEMLRFALESARLEPVPNRRVHPYLALSLDFITTGPNEHDRASLEAILVRERLRGAGGPDPEGPRGLGIKTYEQYAASLEDVADTLNLVHRFHGRHLVADVRWDSDIASAVSAFLADRLQDGGQYDLYLDCPLSVAFAAGQEAARSAAEIAPVERRGRRPWRPGQARPAGDVYERRGVRDVGDGPDLAVAVSVAQDLMPDVVRYSVGTSIGRVLDLSLLGGPRRDGVRDAEHGAALAEHASRLLAANRGEGGRAVHLFMAAPVPVAFFLGAESRNWGPVITYEFDPHTRSYSEAIHLPINEGG